MKKLFGFLLLFSAGMFLASCGEKTTTATTKPPVTKPTVDCATNPSHPTCMAGTTTDKEEEVTINPLGLKANGEKVVILTGAPQEIDPFHEKYSGDRQQERKDLLTAIEQSYKVDVEYKLYEDNAAWGPNRIQAIINGVATQKPIGHVYFIDSSWVPELAMANSLAPIGNYMQKRDFALNTAYKQAMTVNQKVYGMSTSRAENLDGIYFNADLVKSLQLDDPAQKFKDNQWTFDEFFAYLATAKAALGTEKFGIGGFPQDYAFGFVASLGGQYVSAATNDVLINSEEVVKAYEYVARLNEFYEPAEATDAGTQDWKSGKVLFNYGTSWFLNSDTRWADLGFEIGFVPFPVKNGSSSSSYRGAFISDGVFSISEGYNNATGLNSELIYNVLHDILTGIKSAKTPEEAFIERMEKIFDNELYVEVMTMIQGEDKIYCEQVKNLGISLYDATNGLSAFANKVKKGGVDIKSQLDAMKPVYDAAKIKVFG